MDNFKLKSWVTASEEGAAFCAPTPSKVLGMRMTQQAALQYLTGTEQSATGGIAYILFKHGEDLDDYLTSVVEVLPDAIVLSISGDNEGWALTPHGCFGGHHGRNPARQPHTGHKRRRSYDAQNERTSRQRSQARSAAAPARPSSWQTSHIRMASS